MAENPEKDGRQSGEFTEEEARIHKAGFKIIHGGMSRGLTFDDACAGLAVVDPEFRNLIVDDYMKVTVAEEHFQGGRSLEEVADLLKVPVSRIEEAKAEMLREVQKAAVDHFHAQSGGSVFGEEESSEAEEKKNNS